jgi:hypothetical protein
MHILSTTCRLFAIQAWPEGRLHAGATVRHTTPADNISPGHRRPGRATLRIHNIRHHQLTGCLKCYAAMINISRYFPVSAKCT